MKTEKILGIAIIAAIALTPGWAGAQDRAQRNFLFEYDTWLNEFPPGAEVIDVWIPIASDNDYQRVTLSGASIPEGASIAEDPKFGNRILHKRFIVAEGGDISIRLEYEIARKEVFVKEAKALAETKPAGPTHLLDRFLGSTQMVPLAGRLTQISDQLGLTPDQPLRTGRQVYDYVVDLMSYDKTIPGWGRGDALWACDSRTGNCSDFHSIFNGLMRTQDIPARFEIGFPLPTDATEGEITGYHCWTWFHDAEVGWVPVDASEADKHPQMQEYYYGALTPDRVAFSVGRDLEMVPKQAGPPVNFFIYPYVEIDGVPFDGMSKRFEFTQIGSK